MRKAGNECGTFAVSSQTLRRPDSILTLVICSFRDTNYRVLTGMVFIIEHGIHVAFVRTRNAAFATRSAISNSTEPYSRNQRL